MPTGVSLFEHVHSKDCASLNFGFQEHPEWKPTSFEALYVCRSCALDTGAVASRINKNKAPFKACRCEALTPPRHCGSAAASEHDRRRGDVQRAPCSRRCLIKCSSQTPGCLFALSASLSLSVMYLWPQSSEVCRRPSCVFKDSLWPGFVTEDSLLFQTIFRSIALVYCGRILFSACIRGANNMLLKHKSSLPVWRTNSPGVLWCISEYSHCALHKSLLCLIEIAFPVLLHLNVVIYFSHSFDGAELNMSCDVGMTIQQKPCVFSLTFTGLLQKTFI